MNKKDRKKHSGLIAIMIFILLISLAGILLNCAYEKYNKTSMEKIFDKVEEETAYLTEYTIYGTHLNLKRNNK